jgi:hypothetical protein
MVSSTSGIRPLPNSSDPPSNNQNVDLIFNELSLQPLLAGVVEAQSAMRGIVDTLSAALRRRTIQALRTDSQFLGRGLSDGYTIAHWLNDGTVDKEAKRLVRSAATKAPFVESLVQDLHGERLAEFTHNGAVALGLGLAVLRNEAALSANRDGWNVDRVLVHAIYVALAGTEETNEEVCNIYSPVCLTRRVDWFEERARLATRSGRDVLEDAHGLFQWLQFTGRAEEQLRELRGTEPQFVSVVRHLAALSRQAARWQSGLFTQDYPFQYSPESQATLDKYGDQRSFLCADGRVRMFSWHSKISIGAQRIYFHAERAGSRVIIGYIGPHLDTVTG